jgi:hypothetical protein
MTKKDAAKVEIGDKLQWVFEIVEVVGIVQEEDYQGTGVDGNSDAHLISFPLFWIQDEEGKHSSITYKHKSLRRVLVAAKA